MARPSITVDRKERSWRRLASRTVSVVDTATSRMPPPAAVALTRRSAMVVLQAAGNVVTGSNRPFRS